ncbi:MAG: isoprenylcysteine carboxylmethyltransferase family protein [Gemmatimonadaceae bacterium]
MTYSEIAKSLRLPLGFLFGIAYLIFARPTPLTLAVGGAIALVGVFIRGWASGHISKNEILATSGPYAHTRNPLYFGSFLIAAGFAIAAHWALLLVVVAFFVLIYAPTMKRERANIASRFPEAYETYSANVPAFVPRPTPWKATHPDDAGAFSLALYMKHGEWKAGLTYLLVTAWLIWIAMNGSSGIDLIRRAVTGPD